MAIATGASLAARSKVFPPLPSDVPASNRKTAIEIVLTEFRELEAEKRQFAQAILAVSGLVAGADAVLLAQSTGQNALPLAGLAPLTLAALALVLTLRRYISAFVRHLADMEVQLNTLCQADVLTWERRWYQGGPDPRLFGSVVGAGRLLVGTLVVAAGLFTFGIWALLSSPLTSGWPDGLKIAAFVLYVGVCLMLSYLALGAAREHDHEVRTWMQDRGLIDRCGSANPASKERNGVPESEKVARK